MSPSDEPHARRVLLVDDDKKFCRLLIDYLKPLGYDVKAAHTGPEGVDKALDGEWHAVILDVMLPGMDGLEVLKRIRTAKSNVPVLMLTARGEETDRIVGLEVGADDYLPKTFSTRELLARLRSVTRRLSKRFPTTKSCLARCASFPQRTPLYSTTPRSRSRRSSSTCCSHWRARPAA